MYKGQLTKISKVEDFTPKISCMLDDLDLSKIFQT